MKYFVEPRRLDDPYDAEQLMLAIQTIRAGHIRLEQILAALPRQDSLKFFEKFGLEGFKRMFSKKENLEAICTWLSEEDRSKFWTQCYSEKVEVSSKRVSFSGSRAESPQPELKAVVESANEMPVEADMPGNKYSVLL